MTRIRRIALAGALAGAFGAGAMTATGATTEAIITPPLQACLLIREATARGLDARTMLPLATIQCRRLGRYVTFPRP